MIFMIKKNLNTKCSMKQKKIGVMEKIYMKKKYKYIIFKNGFFYIYRIIKSLDENDNSINPGLGYCVRIFIIEE